ncbi:MAG TPA: hypothetical protein VER03_08510 [Bryobacteraceae bacterium]|nr:hypothetical protein [Bryobacteraceae bacterium]
MLLARVVLSTFCVCSCASAQYSIRDRIVLPAATASSSVTLTLRNALPETAQIDVGPASDSGGAFLSPQPIVNVAVAGDDRKQLKIELTNVYFWGEARLPIQVNGRAYSVLLQRGPAINSRIVKSNAEPLSVAISADGRSAVWLYNFSGDALPVRWRIASGNSAACGVDTTGALKDCSERETWHSITIPPAQSSAIRFGVPRSWFNPLAGGVKREASMELGFGQDGSAAIQRVPLAMQTAAGRWSLRAVQMALPDWLFHSMLSRILWTTWWITLGAVFLMAAQVMIPNFRKVLRMENDVEALEERLRAINSRVGDRLLTRCRRELQTVRIGLIMRDPDDQRKPLSLPSIRDKIGLSGNTAAVHLLRTLLKRIDARVRLTELLDERLNTFLELDSSRTPPSLFRAWEQEVKRIQSILSRQFLNDADEKAAHTALNDLADGTAGMTAFTADLQRRITGLKRHFADPKCREKLDEYLARFCHCVDVLEGDDSSVEEGLTMAELAARDVAVSRIEILADLLELAPLLGRGSPTEEAVLERLYSTDPGVLAEARLLLTMRSQGVDAKRIRIALEEGMWDVYSEPTLVLEQDVLRLSFCFREKVLNRAAAKGLYQCFWIVAPKPAGTAQSIDEGKEYESGWDIQVLARGGELTLTPEVYDTRGEKIEVRKTDETKGVLTVRPQKSLASDVSARTLRGIVDAFITAIVPVLTVAITQLQSGSAEGLDISKLVLLGFTSQAIRTAIVPESTDTSTMTTGAATAREATAG